METGRESKKYRLDWLPDWLVNFVSKMRVETTQALREKPEEGIFRGSDFLVNSRGNQMHLIIYIGSNDGIDISHLSIKPSSEMIKACREFVLLNASSDQKNIRYEVIPYGSKKQLVGEAFVILIYSGEEVVLRNGNRISNLPQNPNPNFLKEGFLKISKLEPGELLE